MTKESKDDAGGLDDALQREIDEALGGQSLEELLEDVPAVPKVDKIAGGPVEPGQIRSARVNAIDEKYVLVELGGKDQGLVALEQFDKLPEVGSRIELAVVRYDRNEDMWILSRQGAVERASWEDLQEGQIVEAFVTGVNKGGLTVKFSNIEAFMPVSQISRYRVENPAEYVNQKLRCQVIEVNRREERVIVSARAVAELEAEQAREKLLAELKEGDVRSGVVRQIMPFGAFVDLGGVDGLVHVSQMSYARVEDPAKVVQPGQTVQVKVLKIDRETHRISLGIKQTMPDPWESVGVKYPAGQVAAGTITRMEPFGAFCLLEDGVEGLIPVSEITWTARPKHPSEFLAGGQNVQVLVLSVDPERKRISLSLKQAQGNPWFGVENRYSAGSETTGKATRIAEFGAFVELEPGVEGLIHISELSDDRVRRVEDVVQVGQMLRVRVLEVSEKARRISLSLKNVLQEGAQEPQTQPQAEAPTKKRKKPLRGGLD